jgi:hypothetical protein
MTQFPSGWAKPAVVRGYFDECEEAELQELFFNELLKQGFKRTPWQLILPEQTAGLIKKIETTPEGGNQFHIRFYSDGTIDCELEAHNFSLSHWSGYRVKDPNLLHQFLENSEIPQTHRAEVKKLFGIKDYSHSVVRAKYRS